MIEILNKPLVSVCLITYNHVDFIKDAIESILSQEATFDWNIIIADDCSTDGTTDIVKEFAKKFPEKIQLILQKVNVGMHANFVELFTAPGSKYVAFLDGDDIWTDNKRLSKQVKFLETNPQYGMVYGKYTLMNYLGTLIPLRSYPEYKSGYIFIDIIKHLYLPPMAAALMRNKLIKDIYKDQKSLGNDWFLIASLCKKSEAAFVNESYFSYRLNDGSVTRSQVPEMSALCLKNMSHFEDEYPLEAAEGLKNWRLKQLYFAADRKPGLSNFLLLLKNFHFTGLHFRQLTKCFIRISKLKRA